MSGQSYIGDNFATGIMSLLFAAERPYKHRNCDSTTLKIKKECALQCAE